MRHDEAWFDGFYRQHERRVHAYCARRVGAVDAADVVSQVFAVAWRRRDDVPDGDGAAPWLYGVARRNLSHHWRSARRVTRLAEKARVQRYVAPQGPELAVVASAEHQLVRDAVMSLRPLDREVLLLSAWEGLTHSEIAEVLGATISAVEKRSARAKVRLADRYTSLAAETASETPGALTDVARPRMRSRKGGGAL